jgi:dihydroxy-acid dehydratase
MGLALPTTASIPAFKGDIKRLAEAAGRRILKMLDEGLKTRDILTKESFENAIMVHAAIGGSTNALLHLPAIAREVGISIRPGLWDELNHEIPFLANVRPNGAYPAIFYWYAGGVQGIIRQIKEHLHADAMTVTGKTIGENLKDLERQRYFEKVHQYLDNYSLSAEDIIAPASRPRGKGALAILKGNLAPGHAVIKYAAVPKGMFRHTGPAIIFEDERSAFDAIVGAKVEKGSVIVIRGVGPRGCGMPEMFYPTEALASSKELSTTTALVTDGRFSGASRGPCVGYVSPEAASGGPIAVLKNGDLVEIDIPGRGLNVVGIGGRREDPATVDAILLERLSSWKPPKRKLSGVLGLYTALATSAMDGAYMDYSRQ